MRKKGLLFLVLIVTLLVILPVKVMAANLLSDLQVEGIGSLSLTKNTWNLTLTTSLDYANIIATPANGDVKVEGAGHVKVNPGNNKIVVKATSGANTESYTINLNVIKSSGGAKTGTGSVSNAKSADPVKNPNTGDLLSSETLVLGASAVVLVAFIIRSKKKIFNVR